MNVMNPKTLEQFMSFFLRRKTENENKSKSYNLPYLGITIGGSLKEGIWELTLTHNMWLLVITQKIIG